MRGWSPPDNELPVSVPVDGGFLAAAADWAVVLWPPQPPDDLKRPDLPSPPAGGWFGRLAPRPRRLLGED